ncbi:type II toxin-antitoxin system HipA family toxin [Thioalkalivibrio sp. ALJT]|uniref:type II toxin-antitoxin system HipA family toxin n=1 Tax=Thioalkalivibrio sp. ALJT TaxID=1158146 RepID=UPI0009DB4206|nr:type II toxin-antitoxin system HipA family toxin [Thioalkalivibrio sp. ALJT]
MTSALCVWYGQQPVGRLLLTPGRQMAFCYDSDWLTDGWPISCSLPLTETGDFVPPDMRGHHFFANLLPEGGARDRLVRWLGIADDDFLLLERLGADCAGALQILPEGEPPDATSEICHALENEHLLRTIGSGQSHWTGHDEPPRLSLAGAQDKLAVRAGRQENRWQFFLPAPGTASTHILKLPVPDLRHIPLFEAFTTFLARELDLPAAPVEPVLLNQETLSLSERFDRRTEGKRVVRLHQEDLCQAQGLSRADKYSRSPATFSTITDILREHSTRPARDIQTLAAWQIFNALAGNTDGHLKNLSLLATSGGGWALAPWYDLVSTLAIPRISHRMALPIGAAEDPQNLHRNHWEAFAHQLGVSPRLVQRLIRSQAERLQENADAWHDAFQDRHGEFPALQRVRTVIRRQTRKALRDWL